MALELSFVESDGQCTSAVNRPERIVVSAARRPLKNRFATLLDSALACAVHSQLPAGKAYTTLELKLNIVRALTDKVRVVRAEGRLVHGGKQVATAEGRLFGPDGTLYAHASTTCLVFSLPSA